MAHPAEHLSAAAREIRHARRLAASRRPDRLTELLRASDTLLTPLEELNLRGVDVAPPRLRERAVGVMAAAGILTSSGRVQDLLDGVFDAQRRILGARKKSIQRARTHRAGAVALTRNAVRSRA